jgi:hypothetical protein
MFCEHCGSTGPVDCAVCRAFLAEPEAEPRLTAVEVPEPERIGAAVTASLFLFGYVLGSFLA